MLVDITADLSLAPCKLIQGGPTNFSQRPLAGKEIVGLKRGELSNVQGCSQALTTSICTTADFAKGK
jgi:hypothetical protein